MKKTILITGASRGFGKIWAETFLKRGDNIIATARNIESLSDLTSKYGDSILTLKLDVKNRQECFDVVDEAVKHFGKIDVLINNAGYGLFGAVEEISEKDVHDQFDTNVYGSLWLSQAVIPIMRKQGYGHILQVSSLLGVTTFPLFGLYAASKWAVEAMTESMAEEIKDFGINVTLIEPIGYNTDFAGSSLNISDSIDLYDNLKKISYENMKKAPSGNPDATVEVLLEIVDSKTPPFRIFFGKGALELVKQVYTGRLNEWEKVSNLSNKAHG